jgi:hypothetical protein
MTKTCPALRVVRKQFSSHPRLKYRSIAGSFKGIAELLSFGYKALQSYLLYPHAAPIWVHGNAALFHSNHNRTDLGYPSQTPER